MVQTLRVDTGQCNNNLLYRNAWGQVTRCGANKENKRKEKLNYRFVSLPVVGSSYLVQHDKSEYGKAPFKIVLTFKMEDFMQVENADVHCMYDRVNSNGRAALLM
ncbi:hypothetical protein TNCV_4542701 [Trichonephila clavipes]|nr:hypothetical protein TNCV_4542701 [Trichonephila clavipes]